MRGVLTVGRMMVSSPSVVGSFIIVLDGWAGLEQQVENAREDSRINTARIAELAQERDQARHDAQNSIAAMAEEQQAFVNSCRKRGQQLMDKAQTEYDAFLRVLACVLQGVFQLSEVRVHRITLVAAEGRVRQVGAFGRVRFDEFT